MQLLPDAFPPCCEGLAPLRGTLSCAFGAALLQGPARWGLSHIGFHTVVTLSAPAGHLPLEVKAAIREYHPLNRRHTTLVNLSAPQALSSRAQPRDLYCTAAICTHAPSLKRHLGASLYRLSLTHGLPVCRKDPSTSVGMTFKGNG